MFKKDSVYALVIGLITAFFASLILINTATPLRIGSIDLPLWTLFITLPIVEYIAYVIASGLFSHVLALKQLGRFGIVGLMNFSVDVGILSALSARTGIYGGVAIIPLNMISVVVAIINSYYWQRNWTFAEKAPPTRKEFTKFVVITLIGIAINSLLVYFFLEFVMPGGVLTPARLEVVAKIGATVVSLFWNFLGYKFLVFKEGNN